MSVKRLLDVETCNSRFTLVLSPGPNGLSHTAHFWNVPGRRNRLGRSLAEQHSAKVTHATEEGALAVALVQIEGLDGPLLDIAEQHLHMNLPVQRARSHENHERPEGQGRSERTAA